MNDLVWRREGRDAADRLHATSNFPEFTGRLCPAPCEAACVLKINSDPVTIKQVEVEIIHRAYASRWVVPLHPSSPSGRRVAVIGSGPAAIAAAQQPTRAGHALTVFERDDAPGGLLRHGIPEFKLEKRRFLCLVSKTRSRNQPKIRIMTRYARRRDTNRDPARTRSSSQAAGHGPCVEF